MSTYVAIIRVVLDFSRFQASASGIAPWYLTRQSPGIPERCLDA
jgi:hypothetical protein